MSFHEVLFPVNISWGSQGGPGFLTNIIELDSGIEERVARRSRARRQYDASYGVKTYEDLAIVVAFYIGRKGPASAFRFKDWSDFSSDSTGRGFATFTDQTIGTGDGATTQFQLTKRYLSGSQTEVRNITKPVADTVLIGVNGAAKVLDTDYTVNTATGIVTFDSAPADGHTITAGFNFDVPVRFGSSIDSALMLNLENFGSGSVEAIPMIEVLDEDQTEDDYFYGGAVEHGNVAADFSISLVEGRVHSMNPTTGSVSLFLPDKSTIKPGGPIFILHNLSESNSIAIKESSGDGSGTLLTLAAESGATVSMSIDSAGTTRTWLAY